MFLLAPAPRPLFTHLVVIFKRFGKLRGVNRTEGSDSSTSAGVSASVSLTAVRGLTQIVFIVDTFDSESNKANWIEDPDCQKGFIECFP